ncbi:MAG: restriction endonuclease [Spirochaetes bacterium]|nr:restriction endonuclease [Spirochaetota bacterium]
MLVPSLITLAVLLSLVLLYIYVVAPRLNPMNRADGFLRQDLVDEAILEYKKILDSNPNDFIVHWKLATILFDRGETDAGVLHLEEILRIGSFNYEVEKVKVERALAQAYIARGDILKAFSNYYELLKSFPGDEEALYHASFILLGQEYFEQAFRLLERLVKTGGSGFEVLFGAGIAAYQIQKTVEAVEYFKQALAAEPASDIANLAMAFTLQRKRDYKTALAHARKVIDASGDESAMLVARRLYGILCVQANVPAEGVKSLEILLQSLRNGGMEDATAAVLYDLGFAALHAEMTDLAYDYWDQLYQIDRGFRNIQFLTTQLRKEMDTSGQKPVGSVLDYTEEWENAAFPENFLWDICGLRSEKRVDLAAILSTGARGEPSRDEAPAQKNGGTSALAAEKIDDLYRLDMENFRIIANRAVGKLGFRVDEILPTYRESDGVDFIATNLATKEKTLVWVRRWKDIHISEIPLRNFAQSVNDIKAKQGLFITTSQLTAAAEEAAKRLAKVKIVFPEEFGRVLSELL